MNLIPNTRWPEPPREPASKGVDRLLMLKLSEERHLTLELARVRAEIAPLARAYADARGEVMPARIERMRRDLGAR